MSEENRDPMSPKAEIEKEQFDGIGNALDGIEERFQEILEQKTLSLFVPGWEGKIRARYQLLPEVQMDRLAKRRRDSKTEGIAAEWEVEAQFLVDLCAAVEVRPPESSKYVVLEDQHGPVRFEGRLAAILATKGIKLRPDRAVETTIDFFCPRSRPDDPSSPRLMPNAMDKHVTAILQWHRGERDKIDRTLLGE
jgi:hypothetical protein